MKHKTLLSITLIAIALGACTRSLSAAPVDTAQVEHTATIQPAAAATRLPTKTPTPTPTQMPSATPSPTPLACWNEGGEIADDFIKSDLLPQVFEFRIYLPPCYAEQPERSYPVLYLVHGQTFRQDQWARLGVDQTADALIAAGEAAPFLIVMPRDRVWTPPNEDMFGQALVADLIPYIDETYRTLPEREYRAVGGLSRGAGWAVHLGLKYWENFGIIGAHSLPIFWVDAKKIPVWLDAIPADEMPRIFLDVGDHDRQEILSSAQWFGELLAEREIAHEWYMFAGYHEEKYWGAHIEQYLRFYALTW